MLNLIYGPPGSGKTYASDSLILEALTNGKKAVLLVPEQEAVDTENRIYDRAKSENVPLERLTVVSFRRLANLAFRKHGGIEYSNIGDGGRLLMLWRIIEELSPALKIYNSNRDRSLIELMLSVCSEFKRYCVTPTALSSAADKMPGSHFKDKLDDIALIYAAYCAQTADENTDSSDDINRLAKIYLTEKPDSDELFFIDSFNGFTFPELNVLDALIKHCEVTITVNKPSANGKTGFMTVEKTEKQLLDIAKKNSVAVKTLSVLDDVSKYSASEFSLIREKLFDFSYASSDEFSSENVTFALCNDSFSQAEYIATRICGLIRKGARYRDIAIVSRNTERYEGVLDAVFEKYGIPLFLSSRSRLTMTALYKAVWSALSLITDGYQTEDVMTYLKNSVCGFSTREIDLIESYVMLWGINGTRWTDENDWIMNPSGFTDIKDSEYDSLLYEINAIRRRALTPIITLSEDIKNSNAKDACKAIYNFLLKSGIAENVGSSGRAEDITVYNTFIELLDTIASVIGDIPVNASVFSSLLYLIAKKSDYGKIPSTLDRVTAGDASIIRCNGIKHVFLTDCENGVFPASVEDDSFFTDTEKSYLKEQNINLSPDIAEKNDLETFYFLRCAGAATETLTATLCKSNGKEYPSVGFQRLRSLFPKNRLLNYPDDFSEAEAIQNALTAREFLPSLIGSELYDESKKLFDKLNIDTSISENTVVEPDISISKEIANSLFGNEINLTASRLETYARCPFSYFCKYVLKIREKRYDFFKASDMGTYIHRILEITINRLFSEDVSADDRDSLIEAAVDSAIDEVLSVILGSDTSKEEKRFRALITRLKRTIILLTTNIVNEFKTSLFKPKLFEFKVGSGIVEPLKFTLDDGTKISVYGTVDRVDTYETGGNVYVRIVDYKTGSKEHSVENIKYGIDTQMLLYLFSLWKSDSKEFSKLIGLSENGQIIPAGVLYQPSRLSPCRFDKISSTEQTLSEANKSLIRSGVLLCEPEILNAMEFGLNGKFIPVKLDKEGNLKTTSKNLLVTVDGFGEYLTEIEAVLKDIGSKIKSGNASAIPLKTSKENACAYCELYPICRNKKSTN